jgi:hypothetical protein
LPAGTCTRKDKNGGADEKTARERREGSDGEEVVEEKTEVVQPFNLDELNVMATQSSLMLSEMGEKR